LISKPGFAELRRWLTTSLPPEPVCEAWLIQLFYSRTIANGKITSLVNQRAESIQWILQTNKDQTQAAIPKDLPPGLERARV